MSYIDFLGKIHSSTKRDYLARVNDLDFPKAKAAELAKNLITIIGMVIGVFVMVVTNTYLVDGNL